MRSFVSNATECSVSAARVNFAGRGGGEGGLVSVRVTVAYSKKKKSYLILASKSGKNRYFVL